MAVFDWGEFLIFARSVEGTDSPALRRIGISRAYYAAFNPSLEWLALHEVARSREKHSVVWKAFQSADRTSPMASSLMAARRIGTAGWTLRGLRNEADYRSDAGVSPGKLTAAIRFAEEIRTLLASLPSPPSRSAP